MVCIAQAVYKDDAVTPETQMRRDGQSSLCFLLNNSNYSCTVYCSHCCNQMLDKNHLREERLISFHSLRGRAHHGGKCMGTGA